MTMTSVRVLQGHKGPVRDIKVSLGTPTISLFGNCYAGSTSYIKGLSETSR